MNIVTANRTADGAVIYWNGVGWSLAIAEAELLSQANAEQVRADWLTQETAVIAPEIEPVEFAAATPRARLRERIRSAGPTIDYRPLTAPSTDVPIR